VRFAEHDQRFMSAVKSSRQCANLKAKKSLPAERRNRLETLFTGCRLRRPSPDAGEAGLARIRTHPEANGLPPLAFRTSTECRIPPLVTG
jgi:hypothetical protein